jgi:hypothetical protein
MVMKVLSEENKQLLQKYIDAASVPLLYTDNDKYPVRAGRVARLFLKEFVKDFFSDLDALKGQDLSPGDIGRLFGNPTRISRMSHHILKGMKLAGYTIEDQQKRMLEH